VKTALGRLEIRRWAEEDAANLARMYNRNRDEIIATEPWRTAAHFTEEGQRSRHRKAALQEPPFVGWVVLEDGVVAGTIGLDNVTDGCATLGYWIDAARRRRGLAASAAELVLDQAFTVMALQQLVANTPSRQSPVACRVATSRVRAGRLSGSQARRRASPVRSEPSNLARPMTTFLAERPYRRDPAAYHAYTEPLLSSGGPSFP
jgi:hypothetical protein